MKHLIFYDGVCPLCNRVIRFILQVDKKEIFYFAPLQGETAQKKLQQWRLQSPDLDTLVLLQNYQTPQEKQLVEGKAALRILWLIGGKYALLGSLSFLPSFLFDCVYRQVARYRFRLFKTMESSPIAPKRFLK